MATINRPAPPATRRRGAYAVAAVVAVAGVAAVVWLTRAPPQMGADEEAFTAVDALFTAVTARDERLLGLSERRLADLSAAGRLPADAAEYLAGVVRRARAGEWEAAAERLYDFMRAQRMDGRTRPPKTTKRVSARK